MTYRILYMHDVLTRVDRFFFSFIISKKKKNHYNYITIKANCVFYTQYSWRKKERQRGRKRRGRYIQSLNAMNEMYMYDFFSIYFTYECMLVQIEREMMLVQFISWITVNKLFDATINDSNSQAIFFATISNEYRLSFVFEYSMHMCMEYTHMWIHKNIYKYTYVVCM